MNMMGVWIAVAGAILGAFFSALHMSLRTASRAQLREMAGKNAVRARERTRQALDYVAKESETTGYLLGDGFTIADLTCAALLMPAVDVGDLGGPSLAGSAGEAAWYARWSDHPGSAWVRKIFRDHRRG